MKTKVDHSVFYNIWLFFTLMGIQKPFFEHINTVYVPGALQGFVNYLPYFICICCFIYYFCILKQTVNLKTIILSCLFFIFLFGMKIRGINYPIDDRIIIIYLCFQYIVFLSLSCIKFSDSFFCMGKYFFLISIAFVPILLNIYFKQYFLNILFDYMFLGQGITPVCLFFVFLWYEKREGYAFFFSLILFVIILLFTNRGSFLWTSLAFLYIFYKLPMKRKIKSVVILTLITFVFLVFFYDKIDLSVSRTLSKLLDHSVTTGSGRNKYYDYTLNQIDLNPFIGNGIYKSRVLLADALHLDKINAAYPHNFFLEIFFQFGIIIPVLLILLFIGYIYVCFRNGKRFQNDFFIYVFFAFFLRLMLSGTYIIDFSIPLMLSFICNKSIRK